DLDLLGAERAEIDRLEDEGPLRRPGDPGLVGHCGAIRNGHLHSLGARSVSSGGLPRDARIRSVTVKPVAIATARIAPRIAGGPGTGIPNTRQPIPMQMPRTIPMMGLITKQLLSIDGARQNRALTQIAPKSMSPFRPARRKNGPPKKWA